MEAEVAHADHRSFAGPSVLLRGSVQVTLPPARPGLIAERDAQSASLLERLVRIAFLRLPEQHTDGEFVFTVTGTAAPGGGWLLQPAGTSLRYGAITALGLLRAPSRISAGCWPGRPCDYLVGKLAKRLDEITGLGDAALVCWAAAEAGHGELPHAVERLRQLDRPELPVDVVSAAWMVSALVAARPYVDVEQHLAAARGRLLAARGDVAYPHTIGGGDPAVPRARGQLRGPGLPHPGARAAARQRRRPRGAGRRRGRRRRDLRRAGRRRAVVVALRLSDRRRGRGLSRLQRAPARDGPDGAARPGRRRAAPTTSTPSAGGCAGWPTDPRPARTWCWTSRRSPGARWPAAIGGSWCAGCRPRPPACARACASPALDRLYPPGTVDHECRPYELGWLLMAWLS